ncbi:MAG: cell division protein FtsL [Longimicrobiales bacterium]
MQGRGTLRVALAFAAFLASLSMVVRRQSTAYALLEKLDGERTKRAMIESERSRLMTEMQRLESRSRIAGVAGRWWGMRSPESDEEFVIILRPDAGAASEAETRVAVARATLGRVRAEWGRD